MTDFSSPTSAFFINWEGIMHTDCPTVSVVIPTHDEAQYLPKLLECLRRQTYKYYEVIVADANSQDTTREIANEYGCKVVTGGKVAEGRNAGAAIAKGRLLFFMDSDILVSRQFLAEAVAEIRQRSLDIATCTLIPITWKPLLRIAYGGYNLWLRAASKVGISRAIGSCILVSRELFEQVGGFDPRVHYAEDHDFAVRCGKLGKFGYLKSCSHYASTRRVYKDGLASLIFKTIFCEVHLVLFGSIRHELVKYDMQGYQKQCLEDDFPCDYEFFESHVFKKSCNL